MAIAIIVSMVAGVLLAVPITQTASAQGTEFILNIGVQDEMKTRNLLRGYYFTGDVWTADVLNPLGDGTIQTDPVTQDVLPYIMVGTDQDGDFALDSDEIGVFAPVGGTGLQWVAFYDIRRVVFHDGTPVQAEDILFGYHLEGMSPAIGSSRFTKDLAGQTGTNYTTSRWLFNTLVPATGWLGGAVADSAKQFAISFTQKGPNAQFNRDTLQTTVMPAYFWQGTGVRKVDGDIVASNLHPDFGWALNPDPAASAFLNGVPQAGYTTTQAVTFEGISIDSGTDLAAFDLDTASQWAATDDDLVGIGPFMFETWEPGVIARIVKNPNYFVPDTVYRGETLLRVPALDAMVFRLYRNVQAGVFALQNGEIDFTDWFVPPEFVGPLLADPNIGLKTSADAGYFYMGYNLRRLPYGYTDPAAGENVPGNDIGRPLRLAIAHAVDKRTIVTSLLQNFGVPGHTPVSPTNTLYYNASAPRYDYDLTEAAQILDAAGWPWPGQATNTCNVDGSGCRSLPTIGTRLTEILTPQADYDPIRAAAGTLVAQDLRRIGLNINARPTAFGRIVELLDERNFDMWILGWSLTGYIVPSYLEDFYHSRAAPIGGSNYEGYINTTLDTIIDEAIGASDQNEAVRLWKYAQGVINNDMGTDTLYYRTNIFAFRQDRIDPDSWRVDIGGDVFFYWSWILLDPAPPGAIRTTASAPSAVASGGSTTVTVTVRDPEGAFLPNADVTVAVSSGPGSVAPTSGVTGTEGDFETTFTAPTLAAADAPASSFITVSAEHTTLGAAFDVVVVITTFPPGAQFLSTLVQTPYGNVVDEGAPIVVNVEVRDETGAEASGVAVALAVTPATPSLGLPATSTTDASGRITATGSAPDVSADTTFTVTILAQRGSVQAPSTQLLVTVLDVEAGGPAPFDPTIIVIAGAVIATGAAGGAYYGLRRRGMKK
jgi:ABC-type transport system substrate-binding protein